MMFDFFTRHTAKDLVENTKDLYDMPLPQSRTPVDGEHFRVGATRFGDTTLTIIAEGGNSLTLTMNQPACEQLIRMLQSTFTEEDPREGEEDA